MPYGIHSASDVSQQKIAKTVNGIDGAAKLSIWHNYMGSTQQE